MCFLFCFFLCLTPLAAQAVTSEKKKEKKNSHMKKQGNGDRQLFTTVTKSLRIKPNSELFFFFF